MVLGYNDPIYRRWLNRLGLGNEFPNPQRDTTQGSGQPSSQAPTSPPASSTAPSGSSTAPAPSTANTPAPGALNAPTPPPPPGPTLGSGGDKYASIAGNPFAQGQAQRQAQRQSQSASASTSSGSGNQTSSTPESQTPVMSGTGNVTTGQGQTDPLAKDKAEFMATHPGATDQDFEYAYAQYKQWASDNTSSIAPGTVNTPSFGEFLMSPVGKSLKFDSGTPDQIVQSWVGSQQGLTDAEKAFVSANSSDLYRMYQESQINPNSNVGPQSFSAWLASQNVGALLDPSNKNGLISYSDKAPDAYYTNWVDSQTNLTQDQKDALKSQYNVLYAQYETAKLQDYFGNPSWANFLNGVTAQGVLSKLPDQHPDITYQNWVINSGLTPDQQQALLSRFNAVYAQFYAANQQNPSMNFGDYLKGLNLQQQLALAPEQNTSNTYYNFIDSLKGITPQMTAVLESRYTPVYSQYLALHNQNPTQYPSFSDYLASNFNPLQELLNVPESAPFRGQQTFANRIRWSGF